MFKKSDRINFFIEKMKEKYSQQLDDDYSPYERVELAINRKKPDRVPFDFWAVEAMLNKLKKTLECESEEELLQMLGIDCRIVKPTYIGPPMEMLSDGSYYGNFGTHRKRVSNDFSEYDEYASFPLSDARTTSDIESYVRWPRRENWDWGSLSSIITRVNQNRKYHIRYDIGGIFETAWGLYGLEKFLMDLIQKPEIPLAIMDCVTTILIDNFKQVMAHAQGLVDLVYTYDDIAIQSGLLMSEKLWRKSVLPFHQKLNKEIKKYDLKILYHSCGAIFDLIDPLIDEMHIDVLSPLQPLALKMDMQAIKKQYGQRVSFHGGIDIQKTMPLGSIEDVEREAQERCRILGEHGGYICSTAHYIQADTPIENVLALYSVNRKV